MKETGQATLKIFAPGSPQPQIKPKKIMPSRSLGKAVVI